MRRIHIMLAAIAFAAGTAPAETSAAPKGVNRLDFPEGIIYAGQWRNHVWLEKKYKYHCDKVAIIGGEWTDLGEREWLTIKTGAIRRTGETSALVEVAEIVEERWKTWDGGGSRVHVRGLKADADGGLIVPGPLYLARIGDYRYENAFGGHVTVPDYIARGVLTPAEFVQALADGYELVRWELRKIPKKEQKERGDGKTEE
ncbi:MAG: hypothetical protein V2A58_04295 [Planctomycetota bacterium]